MFLKDLTSIMYSPKLGPLTATCEKTKPGQSSDNGILQDESIRCWLLIWASLRLAVSVLWTGVLLIMTWQITEYYRYLRESMYFEEARTVLTFAAVAIVLQLVEFGMIVTFICAGVKRSASLYQAYYRYCILTLIIYIIAVTLCITLDYDDGHYFGEIYLTYHINELAIIENDGLVFGGVAILDICLEIFLIRLIKRLINKYSTKDITNFENV